MIKTMYTRIYTVTWAHIKLVNDVDEYGMEQNTQQIQF